MVGTMWTCSQKGETVTKDDQRNIAYREKNLGLIIPSYNAIVRTHLEYYIQAWRHNLRKYINKLERAQRGATQVIPELRMSVMKIEYSSVISQLWRREESVVISSKCLG